MLRGPRTLWLVSRSTGPQSIVFCRSPCRGEELALLLANKLFCLDMDPLARTSTSLEGGRLFGACAVRRGARIRSEEPCELATSEQLKPASAIRRIPTLCASS